MRSGASRLDAIVATLVGVLALLVSGYTAYVQKQQVRAQVWPMLQLGSNYNEREMTIMVANKGTGPAIVKHVRITVDGHAVTDWDDFLKRMLGTSEKVDRHWSMFNRRTLSPGETVPVLAMGVPTPGSPGDRLHRSQSAVGMEVCYCSTLGDCWMFTARENEAANEAAEVRSCPAPSATTFRQ